MATASKSIRKESAVDRREALVDRMRQSIKGQGVFLLASVPDYPNRSYPPPNGDLKDLYLVPGQPVAIDEDWLTSPLLMRDFQAGAIQLEYADRLPAARQLDPDPETLEGLPQQMKLMVRTIVESELTAQYRDILRLGEQIRRTGLPAKNSKVTKAYLKGEYAVFLRAVAEFESVNRARPQVLELVTAQLERIEAM